MKLTGPFTVDALYCAELSGPDWEDYISLSQVNDQSGSQRENQSPISQLTEHSASWKPTQILEWSKNDIIFSQLTSSFQMPSREMKEETCDGTLTSVAHSNMWIMRGKEITDHNRAAVSDRFSTREFHK